MTDERVKGVVRAPANRTYPRITMIVGLTESYRERQIAVCDYTDSMNMPIEHSLVIDPDPKLNQSECWNAGGYDAWTDYLCFSCCRVYPTPGCVAQTIEALEYDPKCVVIGWRLDEQEDGSFKPNPTPAGDWFVMSRTEFIKTDGFDPRLGTGGYLEFDFLSRLLVEGRQVYVTRDPVIHQYHPSLWETPEADDHHQDNRQLSVSKGLPWIWWRWPAVVYMKWFGGPGRPECSEPARVAQWEGVPCG